MDKKELREALETALEYINSAMKDTYWTDAEDFVRETNRMLKICECGSCSDDNTHSSDCAVHNAPAYEPGKCNCGAK